MYMLISTSFSEIPDLLDLKQLELLRKWEGELRFLQHFKLKRYSRKHLDQLANTSKFGSVKSSEKKENPKNMDSETDAPNTENENDSNASEIKVSPDKEKENQVDSCMEVDT